MKLVKNFSIGLGFLHVLLVFYRCIYHRNKYAKTSALIRLVILSALFE
uniref:Uncharacterized protein n=1 Tax=Arundo donax TaxID=35708 RepID=A0A0A9ACQ4_ARUDO